MKHFTAALALLLATTSMTVAETPNRGGSMVYMSGKIPSFNPLHGESNVGLVTANTYASLTRLDENNEVSPFLAESYSVSSDGLIYTFNLAQDAMFHNGTPVTSEDVAFSLAVVQEHHRFGQNMFGSVEAVETPDEHTLIVRLAEPHGPFLLATTTPRQLPIMSKDVYDGGIADFMSHPGHQNPVGSGPFKLKEHRISEFLVLERDENHFREETPYLDEIVFRVVTDKAAMRIGLMQEQFHLADIGKTMRYSDIKQIEEIPHMQITSVDSPSGGGPILEFNHRVEPFSNMKVRQAIAHAVDNKYIAETLHGNWSVPAHGPMPQSNVFFDSNMPPRAFDIEKANQLLDEAGYPRGDDGTRFEMGVLYIAPPHEPDVQVLLAEYLGIALSEVGIKVVQQPMPDAAAWSQRMSNWEHQTSIILAGDKIDPAIGIGRLYRCDNIRNQAYTNTSGYCNPEVDELFARGAQASSFEERQAIYNEVQALLVEESPLFWLVDRLPIMAHHKDLYFPSYGFAERWDEVYWKTPQ